MLLPVFSIFSFSCLFLGLHSHHFCSHFSFLFLYLCPSFSYSSYPSTRHPALRHQNSNCWKPRVDLWPGVHGRPHQAGLLLLPFCLQTEARKLRERPISAHQLHLPAGLWRHRPRLQDLRISLVSSPPRKEVDMFLSLFFLNLNCSSLDHICGPTWSKQMI